MNLQKILKNICNEISNRTHTFLWFNEGTSDVSQIAKSLIENMNNKIFISIASLWEISIKTSLGKLSISSDFDTVIDDVLECDIELISISFSHLVKQNKLPFYHKDPFDRLIHITF